MPGCEAASAAGPRVPGLAGCGSALARVTCRVKPHPDTSEDLPLAYVRGRHAEEAKRFKNAHSVASYLGLVPSESTTGGPDKRRLGSITKQGNRMARTMLVQAAWTIARSRDQNDPLKSWFDHVAKTRNKNVAVVGLARKLAGVLWAMWRDGTFYDPKAHAEQAVHGVSTSARQQLRRAQALQRAAGKLRRPAPAAPGAPARAPAAPRKSSRRAAM